MRYRDEAPFPRSRRIVGKRGTRRNAHFVKRLRPHLELLFLMGHSIRLAEQSHGVRTALQTGLQQSGASRRNAMRIPILSHPRCISKLSTSVYFASRLVAAAMSVSYIKATVYRDD